MYAFKFAKGQTGRLSSDLMDLFPFLLHQLERNEKVLLLYIPRRNPLGYE